MVTFIIGIIVGWMVGTLLIKFHESRAAKQEGQPWWTVIGVWPESKERYTLHVQADNARAAEDLTQWEAKENNGELWVTGVFPGKIDNADTYATFIDPDTKKTDWLSTEHGAI